MRTPGAGTRSRRNACLVGERGVGVRNLVLVGALAVCVWGQGVADFIAD
ncbi:hypothetical protein D187_002632 [Cystobacter fuscus DSM 2262]|uniref:Uncharacterized protein n=1 Tax=Cystobacter fuscus (strain ATCC 25194 / DSM 2262 / NBRC 100088 / M29) TaxID=1242864 RepID=S9QTA9_CYSF2|nr:hypothetical protein [Cystobacter fuscus]EPX59888.1 hypothetical protein D187_002632 [Cystobacter fuscus DSM 2262]